MKKRIHPDLFRSSVTSNYLQLNNYIVNKNVKSLIIYQDFEIKKALSQLLKKFTYNVNDINVMRSHDTLNIDIYYSKFFLDAYLPNPMIKEDYKTDEQKAEYNYNQLRLNFFNFHILSRLNFYKYYYFKYTIAYLYYKPASTIKFYWQQAKKLNMLEPVRFNTTLHKNRFNITNLTAYACYKNTFDFMHYLVQNFNDRSKNMLKLTVKK